MRRNNRYLTCRRKARVVTLPPGNQGIALHLADCRVVDAAAGLTKD